MKIIKKILYKLFKKNIIKANIGFYLKDYEIAKMSNELKEKYINRNMVLKISEFLIDNNLVKIEEKYNPEKLRREYRFEILILKKYGNSRRKN